MSKKYIRVDNPRPHLALQAFAIAIEQAVREGYTVSGDTAHHARELNSGCYDITLVLPGVTSLSHGFPKEHVGLEKEDFDRIYAPGQTSEDVRKALIAAHGGSEQVHHLMTDEEKAANFVRVGKPKSQPKTTITSTAKPDDEPVFVTMPGSDPLSGHPILAHLESCKTKQDLLDFAQRHGIVVPEDKQVFTAIKKYLKEQFIPKTV